MSKHDDANLILKLYDLRREEVMRKARNWFFAEFNPKSVEDFHAVVMGEYSAYYRMVTTYWDMACALVNNGAIDSKMFSETNGEHLGVYLKLEPFLPELRKSFNIPEYLQQTEECIKNAPNGEEKLAKARERFAYFRALREEAAKKAQAG